MHTYIYIHIYIYILHIYIHIRTYVCVHMYRALIYICIYIHMYIPFFGSLVLPSATGAARLSRAARVPRCSGQLHKQRRPIKGLDGIYSIHTIPHLKVFQTQGSTAVRMDLGHAASLVAASQIARTVLHLGRRRERERERERVQAALTSTVLNFGRPLKDGEHDSNNDLGGIITQVYVLQTYLGGGVEGSHRRTPYLSSTPNVISLI